MKPDTMWDTLRPEFEKILKQGVPFELIADFCHVQPLAVKQWLKGKPKPVGTHLLNLWYLVGTTGRLELPVLHEAALSQYVTELFGYSVIGLNDVRDIFSISEDSRNITRQLRGDRPFPSEAKFKLEELIELYQGELVEKKNELEEKLRIALVDQPQWEEEVAMESSRQLEDEIASVEAIREEPEVVTEIKEISNTDTSELVLLQANELQTTRTIQLPSNRLLEATGMLTNLMPLLRMAALETEGGLDVVRDHLHYLIGENNLGELANIFALEPQPDLQDTASEAVQYTQVGDALIGRIAVLLREVAPLLQVLFEDTSPEADEAREQLRITVGLKLYSELAVKLSAMRSRQSYDRAKNGEVN